ncbi:MAG: sigma-54-dependent Fis family transcriptional regulator [Beggiatoa sp. IS2]|nr:MAG: sigma-54-dependent Fis family transcriptional regulator [Beggiatoa sp. IS2]
MNKAMCLVVDDEPDILELLVLTLNRMNIDCQTAANVAQAKELLPEYPFDLCLTDMQLPDGDGIELVGYIQHHYPTLPVAVITAHGSIETAVKALKAGAFDFITKPVKLDELRNLVNNTLRLSEQREDTMSTLVGESPIMKELRTKIEKLARSQAPIYIRGESGVGKEVVARLIHKLGVHADKAFIPVNCGAIPTELMESEFFGHKKGSFTGANADKPGLFQAANGGTLFLDEVADLPLLMQVKLLRAIQEKQIRLVGAQTEISVDVRILSATHRDLTELVRKNKFRQDLFYRLNVIELTVPPLRERIEDVPLLVNRILSRFNFNEDTQKEKPTLSDVALNSLKRYYFPGNVRELENILERAIALCENNRIEVQDLQLPDLPVENGSSSDQLSEVLEDIEKETILNALEQTKGNKTQAAKLLGITFGALRYRLQKLKVD